MLQQQLSLGISSDIYALAATFYVLLTGYETDPESGQPVPRFPSALKRAAGEPLVEPQHFNSNISDSVNQAILKGMAFLPQERPQFMREWLDLLGKTSHNLPILNSTEATSPQQTLSTKTNQDFSKTTQAKEDAVGWVIGVFIVSVLQGIIL